jgi:hypothetical protein
VAARCEISVFGKVFFIVALQFFFVLHLLLVKSTEGYYLVGAFGVKDLFLETYGFLRFTFVGS